MGEKDLLELARVPRGTWSAWIRNGHFEGSDSGLYGETEVVAAAIFNVLASALPIRKASIAWKDCGSAVTGACVQLRLDGDDPLVIAIDVHALEGAATGDPGGALRPASQPGAIAPRLDRTPNRRPRPRGTAWVLEVRETPVRTHPRQAEEDGKAERATVYVEGCLVS